jgi:hypothetical protein
VTSISNSLLALFSDNVEYKFTSVSLNGSEVPMVIGGGIECAEHRGC